MWLLMCIVLLRLWVMKMMVLCRVFCSFSNWFCMFVWINGLRVLKVLFMRMILVLVVSVWVRLICWCMLLESWCG